MNSQEYRNLQEAYLNVYQEVDEATAMSKRGLDEPAIRNKIASQTRGGEFADKATALADRETYGNKEMKAGRENLARKQRGDFRNTTSSNPELQGYGYKATTPEAKAKQDARGNQRARAALTPNERKQLNMGFDLYDTILEYLISEGYADTNENALVIMVNMSEEWRESIVEEEDKKLLRTRRKSIAGLNSKPINQYDSEEDKDNDYVPAVKPEDREGYYQEVPTDYRARKRRASGR